MILIPIHTPEKADGRQSGDKDLRELSWRSSHPCFSAA
jgi:hypothetical protein